MNIREYNIVNGYHSLGFFKETYPEISWLVCLRISPSALNDLKKNIDLALEKNKLVAIVLWDEDIIHPINQDLVDLLNSYNLDPVWLITQLDDTAQLMYTFQHNIKCKILELPWWWLNEALCYYNMDRSHLINNHNNNYLCMVGRLCSHKLNLLRELEKNNVDRFGLITLSNPVEEFKDNNFISVNPHPPYQELPISDIKSVNETWISANVLNFLHIEKTYSSIPLVVHSETTGGIFFSTEKSLWPILLGKMVLVHGRPGVMKYLQRFYDFDISRYANLEFDQIDHYDTQSYQTRLSKLVENNIELLKTSHEVYEEFKIELEQARWTIGTNLLNFSINQVKQILKGN